MSLRMMISTPIPDEAGPHGPRRGRLTFEWMFARNELLDPLTTTVVNHWSLGYTIDDARNAAAQAAIDSNCDFLGFLDWDTIPHAETFHHLLQRLLNHPQCDVASALYVCRHRNYPAPLVYFGDDFKISCDWTVGDVLTSDEHGLTGFGCGAMLIRTSLFPKLSKPWFKTTKELSGNGETEDLYFLKKARLEVEAKFLMDTSLLPWHIDPNSGIAYNLPHDSLPIKRWRERAGLPANALPYRPNIGGWAEEDVAKHINIGMTMTNCGAMPKIPEEPSTDSKKRCLHAGCGPARLPSDLYPPDEWQEVRLDIDAGTGCDIVADIRDIKGPSGLYDAIYSSHTLEHLYSHDVPTALAEFYRVLKPGGELAIVVPDVQAVAEHVAQGNLTKPVYTVEVGDICPIDILWGYREAIAQGNLHYVHRTGFVTDSLLDALREAGFGFVSVEKQPELFQMTACGIKGKQDE